MKVFIVAAITANGFIGRHEDHLSTTWTSKEDRKVFRRLTKQAGVFVMGSTTYRTIGKPLSKRRNIIYSRTKIDQEGIETTNEAPVELVKRLEKEGHEELAVCGGATVYDMFLKAGLVDELYLTIEPVLFASGVPLLKGGEDKELRLIDYEKINDSAILVHYEVIK